MGNFLSFPILCILNKVCLNYSGGRDYPCSVNGDDIVFRCPPEGYERWVKGVEQAGFVVSKSKTMVSSTYFTLNSTPFWSGHSTVRMLPFVRPRAVFSKPSSPEGFAGQFKTLCPGLTGERARYWRLGFLRKHQTQVWASQRSVSRGMGLTVPRGYLREARILEREDFYRSFDKEEPLPGLITGKAYTEFPKGVKVVRPSDLDLNGISWRRVTQEVPVALLFRLNGEVPPTKKPGKVNFLEILHRGTVPFRAFSVTVKKLYQRWHKICGIQPSKPKIYAPPARQKSCLLGWGPEMKGEVRKGLGWRPRPLFSDEFP